MPQSSEPTQARGGERWFTTTLMVGSIVLAGLVALLSWQNFRLKREVGALHDRLQSRRMDNAPQPGQRLSPLVLVAQDGSEAPLAFEPGERTLLFIYSKDCGYCDGIKPDWRELVEKAPAGVRAVAIFTDHPNPQAWPDTSAFACPVYGVENGQSTDLVRLPMVPATVLLDDQGVIERAWWGVLDSSAKKAELFAAVGAAPSAN